MVHRSLLAETVAAAAVFALGSSADADPVRVLVWDEQQPVKTKVYENFPGNCIAKHLKKNPALEVRSASIHGAGQGLASEVLANTDVLVFWGHVRHDDISEAKSREIVDLIKAGKMQMITLHSAHWSLPFMIAMEERAAEDALARLTDEEVPTQKSFSPTSGFGNRPRLRSASNLPPGMSRDSEGGIRVELERPTAFSPNCCTPKQPSQVRIILKDHPIVKDVPATFTIPETEMYDEPYHVPAPDLLVLDETWAGGEYFRSGCLWNIGKARCSTSGLGTNNMPFIRSFPF